MVFTNDLGDVTLSLGIRGALSIKFKEVVDVFGLPSHVLALDCHVGICRVEIIYMSLGISLEVNPRPNRKGYVTLTPDIGVGEIWFFPPGEEGFLTAFPAYKGSFTKWAVPWKGYTQYKVEIIW
jgi:hypothetical protein